MIERGIELARFGIMYRTTTIIPFPGSQEREIRKARLKAEAKARADALPDSIRELDVAWLFEEAARRQETPTNRR